MADYKRTVRSLYVLTKCSSDKHWTADHTALLNKLVAAVAQQLALGLVDVGQPATLYVGVNESDMSAVMMKGTGDQYHIVSMIEWALTVMEACYPRIE